MNCKDFENWLLSTDNTSTNTLPDKVAGHLSVCAECEQLYLLDSGLETRIDLAFTRQNLPADLEARIDSSLDRITPPPLISLKRITGIVAMIGILLTAFYLNWNTPYRFQNLQQLSEDAVLKHLSGNTSITFDASRIKQVLGMLSKELKFKVILPDLEDRGYTLLGGRVCAVGKCKTAYFFYKDQEKTCSLFILDYKHLEFEMADGSRFNNVIKGCNTDIWKEKGQVYAMVY